MTMTTEETDLLCLACHKAIRPYGQTWIHEDKTVDGHDAVADKLEVLMREGAARVRDCCDACRWAYGATGLSGRPFEEAFVHRPVRDMRAGDVVRSIRPIEALGRHALGVVHEVETVPEGRRKVAITEWEDEDEVRHVLGEGATGMLVMRRRGETVGRPSAEFELDYPAFELPEGLK